MSDPFPTRFLLNFSHLFIDVIVRIINLTFSTASFPAAFKSAVVKPLSPVYNLPYLSTLIEKVIAIRLIEHRRQNAIMEKFQSTNKAHPSTETALLRVYNSVMFNIDKRQCHIISAIGLIGGILYHRPLNYFLPHFRTSFGIADLALMKSYLDHRRWSSTMWSN